MFLVEFHSARYTFALAEVYGAFALVVALLLIGLLLLKELSAYREGEGWRRLSRALNYAIAPLLVVFLFGVGLKIAQAFR